MSVCIQPQKLVFSPIVLSNLISKFKDKAIDITSRVAVKSICKILEIAYDESYELMEVMIELKVVAGIEDMHDLKIDSVYDDIEKIEDYLWVLHDLFKDTTNIYEMQLFDIVNKTLNNYAKINNILGYFESQIIQNNLKSA